MQRWFHAMLLSLVVMGIVGCSDDSASNVKPKTDASVVQPKPPPPPPPPPPSPTDVSGAASPKEPAPTVQQPVATPQQPAPAVTPAPSPPPPAAVAQLSVRLATGVALAQTGPEGTMMMFSVDYEVARPPNSEGYIWVIERGTAKPGKVEVKLSAKGNLSGRDDCRMEARGRPLPLAPRRPKRQPGVGVDRDATVGHVGGASAPVERQQAGVGRSGYGRVVCRGSLATGRGSLWSLRGWYPSEMQRSPECPPTRTAQPIQTRRRPDLTTERNRQWR